MKTRKPFERQLWEMLGAIILPRAHTISLALVGEMVTLTRREQELPLALVVN